MASLRVLADANEKRAFFAALWREMCRKLDLDESIGDDIASQLGYMSNFNVAYLFSKAIELLFGRHMG